MAHLSESEAREDPFEQFGLWYAEAGAAGLHQPDAMVLATATRQGAPSARAVLLKGFDSRGFVFYSNYESRKGRELAENPQASLVFVWSEISRQVRIEGIVEKVSFEESDAYFASRPLGSRLGALASNQSQIIPGREFLERRVEALAEEYRDGEPPRPAYWGGYRLSPIVIEFWQGRPDRIHDRLRYRHIEAGGWLIERLSP